MLQLGKQLLSEPLLQLSALRTIYIVSVTEKSGVSISFASSRKRELATYGKTLQSIKNAP